jgi:hypothetical protein
MPWNTPLINQPSFHSRMINIQTDSTKLSQAVETADVPMLEYSYKMGHRDARHSAAEIADEADAEIKRLRDKVESLEEDLKNASQTVEDLQESNY